MCPTWKELMRKQPFMIRSAIAACIFVMAAGCTDTVGAYHAAAPGLSDPQKVVVDGVPFHVAFNRELKRARINLSCNLCVPTIEHYSAAREAAERTSGCKVLEMVKPGGLGPWEARIECSPEPHVASSEDASSEGARLGRSVHTH